MDGICEVVRTPCDDVTLTVGQETYVLGMLTVEDWAAITAEVRKLRPDPIRVAMTMVANLEDRESKVFILEKAWAAARQSQIVPEVEVMQWSATPEGAAYCLWLSLRHRHATLPLEVVQSWIHPMAQPGRGFGIAEIADLVDRVHALPPSGPT